MPPVRTEPLPVMLRIVSGRKTIMSAKTSPESTSRKMKIDRNPKKFAKMPPRTGPMAILKFRTAENRG